MWRIDMSLPKWLSSFGVCGSADEALCRVEKILYPKTSSGVGFVVDAGACLFGGVVDRHRREAREVSASISRNPQ